MKKIFLIIFLTFIICAPSIAAAQIKLETGLPNIPDNSLPAGTELPSYINYLFIFGLGAITILALAQMMSGGIKYILAAGNVGDKADAKDKIQQALLGLGVLLASYLLLKIINPDLVNLRNPNLTPIQFRGGSPIPDALGFIYIVTPETACISPTGSVVDNSLCPACVETPGQCKGGSTSNICCKKGSSPPSTGGGTTQWEILPKGKSCFDVLGKNWLAVDKALCASPGPSATATCCGQLK